LELLFATPALKALCLDELVASRSLDATVARRLRARLDDLDAAACLAVTAKLPGRLHPHGTDGHFALNLTDNVELIIAPADEPLPCGEDGEVSLEKVTRVKVISIGRPHA
jgi:proteic killer suppression protein